MKHKQAQKAVDTCACTWVEFGVSVRDLTLAEAIAARNEQARIREPLAFAELPGIKVMGIPALLEEQRLVFEANRFASEAA